MTAMQRFLASLEVHVNEAKSDLTYVHNRYSDVTQKYRNLSKTAMLTLADTRKNRQPRSHSVITRRNNAYNLAERQADRQKPKYTPASQYPVPMQPRLFKPTVSSFNAERVAKLSEMRPIKNQIEDTFTDLPDDSAKVPAIDVEQIKDL